MGKVAIQLATYTTEQVHKHCRVVPLFLRGRIHTGASQEIRTEASPIYEAEFIQGLLKKYEQKLARSFNFTFRYIEDVLSLNHYKFGDHIYSIELEIKDTTNTAMSASYLDLHLESDSVVRLRTKLYDKRDDFNFSIYMQQHLNSTCIWSIYLSVNPIFQSVWFLS